MNYFERKKAEKQMKKEAKQKQIDFLWQQIEIGRKELETETDKDKQRVIRETLSRNYASYTELTKSKWDFWGKVVAAAGVTIAAIAPIAIKVGNANLWYLRTKDPTDEAAMEMNHNSWSPSEQAKR